MKTVLNGILKKESKKVLKLVYIILVVKRHRSLFRFAPQNFSSLIKVLHDNFSFCLFFECTKSEIITEIT